MNRKVKLNRKKLIIVAVIIIILLLALIIILGTTRGMNKGNTNFAKQAEFKSNSEKLIDYDEPVMKYGNDIFILDKLSSSMIRYNLKNNTKSTVLDFDTTDVSEHFFIRSNKLIFSYYNTTFYSDLNGTNIQKLTNGEVVYIDDNIYIFISHKTSRDELYIVSYDNKTFRTTTNLSKNIANGRKIQYLKAEDKDIYFTSSNTNGSISLFKVDIKNDKTEIISTMSGISESDTLIYEFSDIVKDQENYYYVVKELSPTAREGNLLNYTYLYLRSISSNNEEIFSEDVGLFLAYVPKHSDSILFEQYTESGDRIWLNNEFEQKAYTWQELKYGDVTSYFEIIGSSLFTNEKQLVNLGIDLSEYILEKVVRLDDGYYFLISNDEEHLWYHCAEDGNNLIKIY